MSGLFAWISLTALSLTFFYYVPLSSMFNVFYVFTTLLYVHVSNCTAPLNGFVTGYMAL